MKIGIEVEGRLKGIKTLFISFGEDNFPLALTELKIQNIMHLYISCAPKYLTELTGILRQHLDPNVFVTVECDKIPEGGIDPVIDHFMLDITPDVHKLRPKDSIKSHDGNLNVLCTHVETMVRSIPKDFSNDLEVN